VYLPSEVLHCLLGCEFHLLHTVQIELLNSWNGGPGLYVVQEKPSASTKPQLQVQTQKVHEASFAEKVSLPRKSGIREK
jgi:hypothetical protein